MVADAAFEKAIVELLDRGTPQTIHIVSCHRAQHPQIMTLLARLAKAAFVELKQPLQEPAAPIVASATPADAGQTVPAAAALAPSGELVISSKVQWGQLSRRKMWIVCELHESGSDITTQHNNAMLRGAAVEVLCARTFQCNAHFKVIVLASPLQIRKEFPRIVLHLSGLRSGTQRIATVAPESTDAGVREDQLEEWLNYDHCENAEGTIAQFQEDVFNGDPTIHVVKYERSMGRGDTYIRILRDPLKFSVLVNTLDMTKSYAGDILGRCLVSILHTSRKIHTLILTECSLTDVGIAELAMALRKSPYVKTLVLSRNPQITDVGITALSTAFAAGSQCAVESLDLSKNNSVCSEELQWKSESLNLLWDAFGENKTLREVKLSECELQPRDVYEMAHRWLSRSDSLLALNVSDNAFGDAAAALLLEQIRNVTDLDISHTGISSAGFRAAGLAISKGKPLARLRFDSNNSMLVRDDLDLSGDQILSDEMKSVLLDKDKNAMEMFLMSLIDNRTLTELSLARVNVGDRGVGILCDLVLHKQCALRNIDITSNCNIDEHSAHRIKELVWGGYYEREEGDEPPVIESLSLAGNSTNIGERALLALYQNRGLKYLDITDMALNDAMLLPLAEAVVQNPLLCLVSLYVGRNFLFADGVRNLAILVENSKTLEVLSLANTWESFTDEAGRASSLSRTREQGRHYFRPLIKALSRVDPAPPTLRMLDMSSNDVGVELATAFIEALAHNVVFEKLWLLGNPAVTPDIVSRDKRLAIEAPLK